MQQPRGGTDLCRADLTWAKLDGANLTGANLTEANLSGAHLTGADLRGAHLAGADLQGALLQLANLHRANLKEANLGGADLSEAQFGGADLRGANLTLANLRGANLFEANLSDTELYGANLDRATLQQLRGLPPVESLAHAENLHALHFSTPSTLVLLREAFGKAGFRRQERELTYALKRQERIESMRDGWLEGAFHYVFFEAPCLYGMAPGRALRILMWLIPAFALLYLRAFQMQDHAGIWALPLPGRVHKGNAEEARPVRVTPNFPAWRAEIAAVLNVGMPAPDVSREDARPHVWRRATCLLGTIAVALYFSVLSAFHFGWRDFNVGAWISRVQSREYTLFATGWVRTVAGIQSLISVYLLALWALTYFGRPFE